MNQTRVRYLVVLITFLAALLLYLHRFCITYMQQYIKEDLHLSSYELGLCFSAFFFAYALAQVPSGWLSDRFGARWMLTVYIVAWSFFTALMGVAVGFIMLLAIRLAVGIGQAGAYPTSASLVGKWVPFSARGKANSFVAFGGRVGAGIAPIVTVFLVVSFVPVEVPSQLRAEDLLDVHYLCYQLQGGKLSAHDTREEQQRRKFSQRLLRMFTAKGQTAVRMLALDFQTALSLGPKKTKYAAETSRRLTAAPETVHEILRELNRLIQGGVLYRDNEFADIPMERQAKELAARQNALSPDERQRLNRLLLEAMYPHTLKKIYGHGWRNVVFVYGALGLLVAVLWWFCIRDRPSVHPWCNPAELERIDAGRPVGSPGLHGQVRAVPILPMLKSRGLWLMCVNQWGGNVGWVFLVTWLPRYLLEVHQVPYIERGWLAAIPLFGGWAGMLVGGWLTDFVTLRFGLRWRTLPIAFGRFTAMLAYLSCLFLPTPWAVTAAFVIVAFSNDLCNPSGWAYKQDVGGPYVGSIHGWANMWGNLGATVSPLLIAFVVDVYGWDGAFYTCAAAFLIAGVAALGVDARIPIAPREQETEH